MPMEKSIAKAATKEAGLGDSRTVVDQVMFPEIAPSCGSKANVNEHLSGDRKEKPQTHTKAAQATKQEANLGFSRVQTDHPEKVQTPTPASQAVVHEEIVGDTAGRSSGLSELKDSVDSKSSNSESESEEANLPERAAEIARVEEEIKLHYRHLIAPLFPALMSGYALAMYGSKADIPVPTGLIFLTSFIAWIFGICANKIASI
ncbi:hypothetical protein PtA15_5A640 [Puccinia triticina]|uniref:Uncharacterized protein n=1 Tax=Puccinia triticina TaxID=208348 RepID=A0ABY7CIN0_9BASI|nr:uncharacterized protein PtA15_5A640 [Puccinia triticina]WAQ85066.1 hypothetical protein PtA15_5A640 [Puccinia triticina]WAR58396.1 hypothetical protein PtB15_5B630 [Puccinia triticina]